MLEATGIILIESLETFLEFLYFVPQVSAQPNWPSRVYIERSLLNHVSSRLQLDSRLTYTELSCYY